MRKYSVYLLVVAAAPLLPAAAIEVETLEKLFGAPSLIVPTVAQPPKIDGSLDDPAWQKVEKSFMVMNNGKGKPKAATWLKAVSDTKSLYVAVHCQEDRMNRLRASVKETDGPLWSDDSIEMFFDPGHKEDFVYSQFIFNPIGTVYHTKAGDKSWNPETLEVACARLADAWTVELKIGFRELVPDGPLPRLWGFDALRVRWPKMGSEVPADKEKAIEFMRNLSFEESAWSPTLASTSHVPYRFGQLYIEAGKEEPKVLQRLAAKKSLKPEGDFPVTAQNLNRIYGGPSVLVPLVTGPPKVDGDVSDKAWARAAPLNFSPSQSLGKCLHRSIARMLSDRENLYLLFQCFEKEMEFLVADETRDDANYWTEDSLEFFLDVGHTQKVTYYHFGINAVGAASHSRNGFDGTWDPKGMEVKTKLAKDSWSVEVKLPFADLVKDPANMPTLWGVNFMRNRQAKFDKRFEETAWAPTRTGSSHVPERFGHAYFQVGKQMPREVADFVKVRDALVE